MSDKIVFLSAFMIALVALKWLNFSVHVLMSDQIILLGKLFVAFITLKMFLIRMD